MTDQERDLITRFIERVAGAQTSGAPAQGQPLPPIDADADRLIADLFARHPEARYRITQMAVLQEHALVEAQSRINRLQWELQNAQQAQVPQSPSPWGGPAGAPPPQQQSRGFLSGLFGGGGPARTMAPPPQYAPPPPQ